MSEITTIEKMEAEVRRQQRLIASGFEDIRDMASRNEAKTELLRQVWNILSSALVGMDVADPRWKAAATWLADNRMYQNVVPRLPCD